MEDVETPTTSKTGEDDDSDAELVIDLGDIDDGTDTKSDKVVDVYGGDEISIPCYVYSCPKRLPVPNAKIVYHLRQGRANAGAICVPIMMLARSIFRDHLMNEREYK